jgi:hypothetical protein
MPTPLWKTAIIFFCPNQSLHCLPLHAQVVAVMIDECAIPSTGTDLVECVGVTATDRRDVSGSLSPN